MYNIYYESEGEVAQSCAALCDTMGCNLPGFSVHGIFSGKSTGVGCHFHLQGIFLNQGSNPGLLHCRQMLYPLSHQGSPNSILKSIDITLPTKVHLIKALFFPVVVYGCERWIIKKAECRKTDAFELWCWRKLLRVPWTARISNQSILKEINPEYSLEGPMLKLKLQWPPDAKN